MKSMPNGNAVDLYSVRCFVAVADAGTVTSGAGRLGVGQPAVTRRLQQLERELGVSLFHREDGRLHLTAAGHDLLPAARDLLQRSDELARTARTVAAGRLQRVRLASTGTTRDDVLAPWLATWPPGAPLASVAEAPVDELYERLHGDADLAVVPAPPPGDVSARVVADLPLWAYVAPGHPWARRGGVAVAELADAELLLLSRAFHARRRLDEALEQEGLAASPRAEFGSPVVAQAVAASGRGVCVVTDDPRFDLVPLPVLGADGRRVDIRLHAAWDPRHHARTALARLAAGLAAFVAERYAQGARGDLPGAPSALTDRDPSE